MQPLEHNVDETKEIQRMPLAYNLRGNLGAKSATLIFLLLLRELAPSLALCVSDRSLFPVYVFHWVKGSASIRR